MRYADAIFKEGGIGINRFVKWSSLLYFAVFSVFVIVTPPVIFTQLQDFTNMIIAISTISVLVNMAIILFKSKPHCASLLYILVLIAGAINVALGLAEILLRLANPHFANVNFLQIGVMVFIFINTIAISIYFRRTEEEAEIAKMRAQELAIEKATLERVDHLKIELMRTISHEMRTPLAVMVGFAQLSAKDVRLKDIDSEIANNLDTIADEARRMNIMIEELSSPVYMREFSKDRREVGGRCNSENCGVVRSNFVKKKYLPTT